ncbi:MAG: hypothetical protein ABI831_05570 [Betaproteobacteria bacterium]
METFWAGTLPNARGFPSRRGDLYVSVVVQTDSLASSFCDLRRSSDFGQSWTTVAANIGACVITIDPLDPRVMYGIGVGYSAGSYAVVFRSLDGGVSWQNISSNVLYPVQRLRVATDGTVYALSYGTVMVSRDRGVTWTRSADLQAQVGDTFGESPTYDLLPLRHPLHGDNFVVAGTANGVFVTVDGGVTWRPAGLQGFVIDWLDPVETPAGAEVEVRIGYRGGVAMLRGEAVLPLSTGLTTVDDTVRPVGSRYALSSAGFSICADTERCIGGRLPQTATLIEYHNSLLDHYFMTIEGAESTGIDQGAAGPGWSRTGFAYEIYPDTLGASRRVRPVCRFYGTPGIGPNSHFFTLDAPECAKTRTDAGWTLESASAFAAREPDRQSPLPEGTVRPACGTFRTLYRLYNNRFAQNDSNHRYVADAAIYQSMQAQGWKGEGQQLCARQ